MYPETGVCGNKAKKKHTFVSRKAGDEKNLNPGGHKSFFLNQFNWIF